jgi:hypothetical protein
VVEGAGALAQTQLLEALLDDAVDDVDGAPGAGLLFPRLETAARHRGDDAEAHGDGDDDADQEQPQAAVTSGHPSTPMKR